MSIHIAITRRVKPGREAEFERLLREFVRESFDHGAVTGVHMIAPAPGSASREWGILRSFRDAEARDAFYASPAYREWKERATELTEGDPEKRQLHGLEAFFSGAGAHPPRWKMAVVTLLGVYPASLLVPRLLRPVLGDLPRPALEFFIAAGIVAALTWLIMPALTTLLRPWLSSR